MLHDARQGRCFPPGSGHVGKPRREETGTQGRQPERGDRVPERCARGQCQCIPRRLQRSSERNSHPRVGAGRAASTCRSRRKK